MNNDAEFMEQVRDALAHLYDHVHLQRHPLAERLVAPQSVTTRTRGQELRRILLDAIEALNPGDNVPLRATERRAYAILFGLYVEGGERHKVAESLGIGDRQLRRDQTEAVAALASILRDHYLTAAPVREDAAAEPEPLRSESERLAQQREMVDVYDLVNGLLLLLEPKARAQGVRLISQTPPDLPKLHVNRILVRQILISLAGYALANLPLTRLSFQARLAQGEQAGQTGIEIGLDLKYRRGSLVEPDLSGLTPAFNSAEPLIAALAGHIRLEPLPGETQTLWLWLPYQAETVVLVVDDNEELFALFQRYVGDHPYQLIHAQSVDQALRLVQSNPPDVITLDLMMPNRDGWELLQMLRADPTTIPIPVIVCSVLEDPDLALSLGAQAYLKKPIGAVDLLQALAAQVAPRQQNEAGL
jgi:CheY-like chemotaxis protein